MKTTTDKKTAIVLALIIRPEFSFNFAHMHGSFSGVKLGERSRNFPCGSYAGRYESPETASRFFDVTLYNQTNFDEDTNPGEKYFYALETRYGSHCSTGMNQFELETGLKTLKTINNAMARMDETEGHVRTGAQHLYRAARAAKAKYIMIQNTKEQQELTGYTFSEYPVNADGLRALERLETAILTRERRS